MKTLLIVVIALILVLGGYYAYRIGTAPSNGSQTQACTMEARLCPDGSYVGRTGPNCEFAQCPSPTININGSTSVNVNY